MRFKTPEERLQFLKDRRWFLDSVNGYPARFSDIHSSTVGDTTEDLDKDEVAAIIINELTIVSVNFELSARRVGQIVPRDVFRQILSTFRFTK
mgnify:CR=1 FL=1